MYETSTFVSFTAELIFFKVGEKIFILNFVVGLRSCRRVVDDQSHDVHVAHVTTSLSLLARLILAQLCCNFCVTKDCYFCNIVKVLIYAVDYFYLL